MIKTTMKPEKVTSVLLKEAVTIPGTKVVSDFTLSPKKQIGISISVCELGVLVDTAKGQALIPMSNVKVIILGE
jgi:hypothetical protein